MLYRSFAHGGPNRAERVSCFQKAISATQSPILHMITPKRHLDWTAGISCRTPAALIADRKMLHLHILGCRSEIVIAAIDARSAGFGSKSGSSAHHVF